MADVPKPSLRTRSKKRRHIRAPKIGSKVHYKKGKPRAPQCSICGKPLAGIPHLSTSEIRRLSRNKRRTWRPYGGHVCSKCLKDLL